MTGIVGNLIPALPLGHALEILPSYPPRQCYRCGKWKPLTKFAPNPDGPKGRRNMCGDCRSMYDCERSYTLRAMACGNIPVVELLTKDQVTERYGEKCVYCRTAPMECLDHVFPVRAGGHHTLDYVVPSCLACNMRKRWMVDEVLIRDERLTCILRPSPPCWYPIEWTLSPAAQRPIPARPLPERAVELMMFGLEEMTANDLRLVWTRILCAAMRTYTRRIE